MTQSGDRIPLQESASPPFRRKHQDFASWLQALSLEKLQELYHQHVYKNSVADGGQELVADTKDTIAYLPKRIVLRRSVFLLVTYFIGVEIFFDLLYIALRLPLMYINIPLQIQGSLTAIYLVSFLVINLIKVFFIIIGALRWVTSKYEITTDGIRFRYGILSRREKIFLCAYMQKVTFAQSFWGRVFNFGSIEVYNPAVKERILLDAIPNPSKYAEIIKKNLPSAQAAGGFINIQT